MVWLGRASIQEQTSRVNGGMVEDRTIWEVTCVLWEAGKKVSLTEKQVQVGGCSQIMKDLKSEIEEVRLTGHRTRFIFWAEV